MKDRYEMYRGPSRGNMRKPRPGTILLLLWGVFLSLAVYGYLAWLQPSRLASTVSQMLESRLDVQCRIGEVSLSFLPVPTIHASDLALLRGSVDDLELHVRKARIQIGYLSLLRLKPVVRSLSLESPTLDISSDLIQKLLDKKKAEAQAADAHPFSLSDLPGITGVRISVENGTCRITGAEGKGHLSVSGINVDARMPGLLPGHLDLAVGSLRYTTSAGLDASASDTRLSLSSLRRNHRDMWRSDVAFSFSFQLASLDRLMGHEIAEPYRYFPMPESLKLSLTGEFSASPEQSLYKARGTAQSSATLVMNGHPVPISLSVPFDTQNIAEGMDVADADVRMGDDNVVISGRVTGLADGNPVLNGRADIRHFSLARWFGFGQAMTAGLQRALDGITGSFDGMELSLRGVTVSKLKAQVLGIALEGSGSCRDYLKPEILISGHARQADLNSIFPELRGEFPDMSHLPPPVLPLHDDDDTPQGPPHVGYDIHISADSADIMNFRVSGADVHVVPAPSGHPMLNIAVAGLYGGKATSKVYLDDKVRVTADFDRVSMDGLTRALAGYPALTGLMKKGSADISFVGGSGLTILSTLGGTVKASLEKGSLNLDKNASALPFASLAVSAQAVASPGKDLKTLPPVMDFRGNWNVDLASKGWSVAAEAKQAALSFSTRNGLPTAMRRQPVSIQATLDKSLSSLLADDLKFTLAGKGSYSADSRTVSLSDATLRHQDFTLAGSLSASDVPSRLSLSGKLALSTSSLRRCAALFGVSLPSPAGKSVFRKAEAEASVTVSSQMLSLDKLHGSIDGTSFSGSLHQSLSGRPTLTGALNFPVLNIDDYRSTESRASSSSTPLPLSFLKNTDLSLSLSADRLRAFSTTLADVSLPVSQKNGTLSAPLKAVFPGGGQAEAHFQAALAADQSAADLSLVTRCRNMNMMSFSRDRGQKTLIGGTGTFDASLRSRQKHWEDWKRALGGKLSLFVSNGAIVTPESGHGDRTRKESRTDFKTMSMTISLSGGVASCRDFLIKGSPITITGGGTASLATETIDAEATVTLAGIPEMPLSITGNLFSPKITYKLLGAVTGTVGNLGSGVIDLVGGVLSAPFKLFMK